MWFVLFACSPDAPPTQPAPVVPEPAPAVAEQPAPTRPTTVECSTNERVRLRCSTANGKQLALCQDGDTWHYRFGQDAIELSHDGPFFSTRQLRGEDGEERTVGFERDGHTYAVVTKRVEDVFEVEIAIAKGAKTLATLPCGDLRGADLTEITLPPPPATSYVGKWASGENTLEIREADGQLSVRGSAIWVGDPERGQVRTGEVDGSLAVSGDALVYAHEECELTIRRVGLGLWVEDNLRCGGLNVSFMGDYDRG